MTLRFEQPEYLWLIALALPLAAAAFMGFRAMAPIRRWSAVVLRTLLIALCAAMLAGASMVRTTERLAVVAVVDVSGSVRSFADAPEGPGTNPSAPFLDRVREFLKQAVDIRPRPGDDLAGLVLFDGRAVVNAAVQPGPIAGRPLDVSFSEGTDLAAGIRLARALIPADAAGRLVLISDGNQTTGDALAAARENADSRTAPGGRARALPIDTVHVRYDVPREVIVEAVESPTRAAAEAQVTVRVVLTATAPSTGTLRLLTEDRDVDINGAEPGAGRRVTLAPGRNVYLLPVQLTPGRIHRFEAVYEPDAGVPGGDTIAANNRSRAFTITPGAGNALLIDGVSNGAADGPGAILARTLRSEGVGVDVVSPEAAPADLLALQAYDLVLLQNVSAEAMPAGTNASLARYVTELGGGLVMIGGPDSFGPGGWKGTELEPILPVRLDLPDRLIVTAAAVVFIIDKSGSMNRSVLGGSRSQQEIANDGAALAIRTLDKEDLVGVIAFDSTADEVIRLDKNADPDANARTVQSIPASGGTNLPPAMELALTRLEAVKSQTKHVIILSDGQSKGRNRLPDLSRKLAAAGIRISTISVGDDADTDAMSEIARIGKGEHYKVIDPNVLPKVFLKAVRVVRTPMVRESPFTPLLTASSPTTDGLDAASMPSLGGLVLTQPRTGDDPASLGVTLAMMTPGGEPVLAHWQAGLGQVAAFTSDAHRWAEPWLRWPGYRRMWMQVARTVSRATTGRTADLFAQIVGDELRLRVEASGDDGRPLDNLVIPGAVYAPDGSRREVSLGQTGPGVYEAVVPAGVGGTHIVTLSPRQPGVGDAPGRALPPIVGGAVRPAGAEFRALRSNGELLAQISAATGGRSLSLDDPAATGAALFDRSQVTPRQSRTPLWPILLAWTLGVMMLDVATRRLAWDRLLSRQFGATLRADTEEATRDRSAQAARAAEALRRAAPADAPAPAALGEAEARRLVEEAAQRRRERRAAPAPGTPAGPEPDAHAPDSGLLAAKRRARERFDKEQGS